MSVLQSITNDLRKEFLQFFHKNQHEIIPSSFLIPNNDPSLLFTNSGMVQFKDIFLGKNTPKYLRAVSAQKCLRAGGKHNDLDNVGYTKRHHTFFEMLGNFSFGNYFKETAIELAWNFLIKELNINPNKLYITVYHNDEEALKIWKKISRFSENKIIQIDTEDNFWSMGATGPCGPSSEIFFDHGDKYIGNIPGTGNEGDRYVEIWNLVFMQYEQKDNGTMIALPKPSIDTGIGLERLSAVMHGVADNFEIDIFNNIISVIKDITQNDNYHVAQKVIADHLRSACFLIAEGVLPSNDGRGYVLRRIMRRAMRYIKNINYKQPLLHQLVDVLIAEMGQYYSELVAAKDILKSVLYNEEEKFSNTLEKGLKLLDDEMQTLTNNTLNGEIIFKLYDTYGFPPDLTKNIAMEKNINFDEHGFNAKMQEQKNNAKKAWIGSGDTSLNKIWFDLSEKYNNTEFVGYLYNSIPANVISIINNNDEVEQLSSGEQGWVILNQTPFYAESGGQIADTGVLIGINCELQVLDVQTKINKIFYHKVLCTKGILKIGMEVQCIIDDHKRSLIRANHSATHLLHQILKTILGSHVAQKGSLVTDEKLRFDFTHNQSIDHITLFNIEKAVNERIIKNYPVTTNLMEYHNAVAMGAIGLFGEKYENDVRVVQMGDSMELCGGTHVRRTGDIGIFKIIYESSVGLGIRRIEAYTNIKALEYCNAKFNLLTDITAFYRCSENDLMKKIHDTNKEFNHQKKYLEKLLLQEYIKNITLSQHKDITLLTVHTDVHLAKDCMTILEKKVIEKYLIMIFSQNDKHLNLLLKTDCYNAKDIAVQLNTQFNSKGGGNNATINIAKLPDKSNDIIQYILKIITYN